MRKKRNTPPVPFETIQMKSRRQSESIYWTQITFHQVVKGYCSSEGNERLVTGIYYRDSQYMNGKSKKIWTANRLFTFKMLYK